ncbi:MAG: ZIP family metal transporter [Defluviitaleaceae bacterium]|nr:ZIP family metal transporter [Defluviitaleaceae bacterium]
MNNIVIVFVIYALILWAFAAVGSALVVFFKKENFRLQYATIGFAAGVMIVVAFLHLLLPAVGSAEIHSNLPAMIPVVGGFLAGCLAIILLDRLIARVKRRSSTQTESIPKYKQSFMMMGVISVHKLPEGLAVGILVGALGQHFQTEQALALIPVIVAIGLHNLPEGTIVSVSFMKEGLSKPKSFFMGQLAGLVQVLAAAAGFILVLNVDQIMPYALAIGAGAMIWVAVHELIPEALKIRDKHPYYATIGIFAGILLMVIFETAVPHNHSHGHCCHLHHLEDLQNLQNLQNFQNP